ncbi:hypothetical protein BSKO_07436 [Bryopsis sp. KO-2023]|nr:hypothetical protein BSKO_07436 [Bryopsis sp. KO-2023]
MPPRPTGSSTHPRNITAIAPSSPNGVDHWHGNRTRGGVHVASMPSNVSSEANDALDLQEGSTEDRIASRTLTAPPFWKAGWIVLVVWCTLSVVISYADRTNISTAILKMQQDFQWNDDEKGVILSVFFLGYGLTQIIGGQIADKIGGKQVLSGGIIIWSVCTFFTPQCAKAGFGVLLANRVLMGMGEGVAFPAIHSLISSNLPRDYQSTAVAVVTAASYAGTVFAFGLSPWIIKEYGWEWVFYSFGLAAALWLPPWFLVSTKPPKRKRNETEVSADDNLVKSEEGSSEYTGLLPASKGKSDKNRGILSLLRTKPVAAICIAQYTSSWGLYVLINWLPTFFKEEYSVPVEDVGMYTILPYMVQAGVGLASGPMADGLLARNWSVKSVRRLFQAAGMIGPAFCLSLAVSPLVPSSAATCSVLINIGLGFSALTLAGVSVSHLDVAPSHAGAVFGAGNTAATAAGFIGVYVTGWLLEETHSWSWVFGVTSAHYIIGTVIWLAWVGGSRLPQDRISED